MLLQHQRLQAKTIKRLLDLEEETKHRDDKLVEGALAIAEMQGMLEMAIDDGDKHNSVIGKFEEVLECINKLIDRIERTLQRTRS